MSTSRPSIARQQAVRRRELRKMVAHLPEHDRGVLLQELLFDPLFYLQAAIEARVLAAHPDLDPAVVQEYASAAVEVAETHGHLRVAAVVADPGVRPGGLDLVAISTDSEADDGWPAARAHLISTLSDAVSTSLSTNNTADAPS